MVYTFRSKLRSTPFRTSAMTNFLSERLDHRPMTEEDWPFFLALNQDRQVDDWSGSEHLGIGADLGLEVAYPALELREATMEVLFVR